MFLKLLICTIISCVLFVGSIIALFLLDIFGHNLKQTTKNRMINCFVTFLLLTSSITFCLIVSTTFFKYI